VSIGYSYQSSRKSSLTKAVLLSRWTLIGAIALSFLSASEPQWLSWLIPLGILYGATTGRVGLQYFSYVFGVVMTFLVMTLLQASGYLLLGSFDLIGFTEGLRNSGLFYALMSTVMLLMFCGYVFVGRLKHFRFEILPFILLIYFQIFFWLEIAGIGINF